MLLELERLRQVVRPTTIIRSELLDEALGLKVVIASETFQHTGSFKFRAAYNVVQRSKAEFFIAASSGNFGQALAYACRLLGRSCIIVMPGTSAAVKIDRVRRFGAVVDVVDVDKVSRAQRVAQLKNEHPAAKVVSAYDDDDVIEGNSTLADELVQIGDQFDCLIAPVGGGGLTSGLVSGLRRNNCPKPVFGAEPQEGNDAARSFRLGRIVANDREPATMADGARTLSLGLKNFDILKTGLAGVVEVPEEYIGRAVSLLYQYANLKSEPTGALSIAALLAEPDRFARKTVCCIVSGGNVDADLYCRLIAIK